jgi:hypothetical protein
MVRLSTATSAEVEPDMPEKNMLNTATTWPSPPRIWPTSACDRLAMRITTLAEVISSPTRRKNGTASSASESTPSNIFWISEASVTSVNSVPISTPAISENATGTPR